MNYEELIISKNTPIYTSTFSHQMDAIVFIVLQVFLERAGKLFTVSMFPLWDIVSFSIFSSKT